MKIFLNKASLAMWVTVVILWSLPLHTQEILSSTHPTGAEVHHDELYFLSQAQRDQLNNACGAALAANPGLIMKERAFQAERKALHANTNPTDADTMAYGEAKRKFDESLKAAELKIEPNLQAIFDEIDQHHKDKLASTM